MLKAFEEATVAMRRAVTDQTDKLMRDLEQSNNALMKAGLEFDSEMASISTDRDNLDELIRKERLDTDAKERRNRNQLYDREKEARKKMTTAMTNNQMVIIALQKQINDGVIYTDGEAAGAPAQRSDEGEVVVISRTPPWPANHPATERRDSIPLAPRKPKLQDGDQF